MIDYDRRNGIVALYSVLVKNSSGQFIMRDNGEKRKVFFNFYLVGVFCLGMRIY